MLLLLAVMPLPEPYWCLTDDGLAHNTTAPPCNPHASKEGGFYATLMMLAALGYGYLWTRMQVMSIGGVSSWESASLSTSQLARARKRRAREALPV